MTAPYLLAETPRAGATNHRFIASPGAGLDDVAAGDVVAEVLTAAGDNRSAVRGSDYLAVIRRGVFQVKGDRRGTEVLIYMNDRLRDRAPAAIAAAAEHLENLQTGLGDVAAEVASRPGLLVEHDRFGGWLAELDAILTQPDPLPAAESPSGSKWTGVVAALACLLLGWVIGAFTGPMVFRNAGPPDAGRTPVSSPNVMPDGTGNEQKNSSTAVTTHGPATSATGKQAEAAAVPKKSPPQMPPVDYSKEQLSELKEVQKDFWTKPLPALSGDDNTELEELRVYLAVWREHLLKFRELAKEHDLSMAKVDEYKSWHLDFIKKTKEAGKESPTPRTIVVLKFLAQFREDDKFWSLMMEIPTQTYTDFPSRLEAGTMIGLKKIFLESEPTKNLMIHLKIGSAQSTAEAMRNQSHSEYLKQVLTIFKKEYGSIKDFGSYCDFRINKGALVGSNSTNAGVQFRDAIREYQKDLQGGSEPGSRLSLPKCLRDKL